MEMETITRVVPIKLICRKLLKKGGFAPLLLFLFNFLLFSWDFSSGVYLSTSISSNIYSNYEKISDVISRGGLDISLYPGHGLELYVFSDYSSFKNNSWLSFLTLEAGLDWIRYFKGRSLFHLNFALDIQRFTASYDYYNYRQPSLTAEFKYYLSPSLLLRSSYSMKYTRFTYYPAYSSFKHYFFVQLNEFLPLEMAAREELGGRIKKYKEADSYLRQIYAKFRLSKGFGYRIGVAAQLELKKNWAFESVPGIIEENFFFTTPFYDEFSWDGYRAFVQAKVILPLEIELTARASHSKRNFTNIPALDLEGNPIVPLQDRRDYLNEFYLSLSRKWRSFGVSIRMLLRHNTSNDPYFTFSDNYVFAGLYFYPF